MANFIAILCAIVHICRLPSTPAAQALYSSPPGYPGGSAPSGRSGVWIDATGGQVPPGAVVGGQDCNGERLYVARAKHNCAILPGKLVPSHGCANIPWGGQEFCNPNYQVLVGGPNNWIPTYGPNVPPGAFPGGETENGEPLYICRVRHEGCITTGKMQISQGVCYIPFGGKELKFRNYEILMP